MKQIILTFLVFLLLQYDLFGQTIRGVVKDSYGNPITGASIGNSRTGYHTHTDELGEFSMGSVQVGDSIKMIHMSYLAHCHVINSLTDPLSIILEAKVFTLEEVVISTGLDASNVVLDVNLEVNPVNSSQEILRQVPGLFIAQHAGGGKAEQIFLRGFDIDHNTDIAITADGVPVNMVSHAHGQGYADLHFLIPETIENIAFGKGPYYASKGDFSTAGYVDLRTKKSLKNSLISMEVGDFNTKRILGMFNLLNTPENKAYFASEYLTTDGPFESPQNFNRLNIFSKFNSRLTANDEIGISLSYFKSKWDASGQIPQRAVNSGLITRFGAIDNTEGGNTSRANVNLDYNKKISERATLLSKFYYSTYDFELHSNFTFFLEDTINGDQIRQKERRSLVGLSSTYNQEFSKANLNGNWSIGVSLRNDQSMDNELSHTRNRQETLKQIQLGNINHTNIAVFFDTQFDLGRWTINPALRMDYFDFQYNDQLQTNYETQSENQTILSPKLNILYNYSKRLQLYLKTGKGFHSNDTRVVVAQNGNEILPAAYGYDIGFLWKPFNNLLLNTAYWHLSLEQEFVYVGDAGIVEPGGETRRQGADLSLRYQPIKWLFANVDATYTNARAINESKGEDYIPLAPEFTLTGGLNVISQSGFYGGINMRHIGDRPANEDNSIIAKGYTVFDLNAGYNWKQFDIGFEIQNLFDSNWNEAQFATESRLKNEISSVEELHFTPGTPFFIKGKIAYKF